MTKSDQDAAGRKQRGDCLVAIVIMAALCGSLAPIPAAVAQTTINPPGVLVPLSALPDLTIQAAVTPNPVSAGAPVTYTFIINNAPGHVRNPKSGTWETINTDANGVEITFYSLIDSPKTSTVDIRDCVIRIEGTEVLRCIINVIPGNGSGVITIPSQAPFRPGPFTVRAAIDEGNQFHEIDETNNTASVTLNIN